MKRELEVPVPAPRSLSPSPAPQPAPGCRPAGSIQAPPFATSRSPVQPLRLRRFAPICGPLRQIREEKYDRLSREAGKRARALRGRKLVLVKYSSLRRKSLDQKA